MLPIENGLILADLDGVLLFRQLAPLSAPQHVVF
jgi:hypothetical protein